MPRNGRLTSQEKKFIEEHATNPEWTDQKIADHLNRHIETVCRFRKDVLGVQKKASGQLSFENSTLAKSNINKSNLTDDEKIRAWKSYFKTTIRYKKLKEELHPKDLEYFSDAWAKYNIQFEDLTATEENTLQNLITYEIKMSDTLKDTKLAQQTEDQLREILNGKTTQEIDMENEEERQFYELVQASNRAKMELNKEFRELQKMHSQCMKDLNATREQREQFHKIGADTFLSLVRQFCDEDKRREAGKYNELLRMSIKKKTEALTKPHKFTNGVEEPILLRGKDFVDNKEKKKDE